MKNYTITTAILFSSSILLLSLPGCVRQNDELSDLVLKIGSDTTTIQLTDFHINKRNQIVLMGTEGGTKENPQFKRPFLHNVDLNKTTRIRHESSVFNVKSVELKNGETIIAFYSPKENMAHDKITLVWLGDDFKIIKKKSFGFRHRLIDILAVDNSIFLLAYSRSKRHGELSKWENKKEVWKKKIEIGKKTTVPKSLLFNNDRLMVVGQSNSPHNMDGHNYSVPYFSSFLAHYSTEGDEIFTTALEKEGSLMSESAAMSENLSVIASTIISSNSNSADIHISTLDNGGNVLMDTTYLQDGVQEVRDISILQNSFFVSFLDQVEDLSMQASVLWLDKDLNRVENRKLSDYKGSEHIVATHSKDNVAYYLLEQSENRILFDSFKMYRFYATNE